MPRNVERDALREAQRRQRLLEAGLKLFSRYGIETVTLQNVADEAEVGIATLYKYYENKDNLAMAISAYIWNKIWKEYDEGLGVEVIESYNAYQRIEGFFDLIISLYKEHPEILRFSGFYKTYINRDGVKDMSDNEHLKVLAPIGDIFHNLYEKAKIDKSIRTDVDELDLFTAMAVNMLGTAERYAMGIVWARHEDNDYTNELLILKDMMLSWLTVK